MMDLIETRARTGDIKVNAGNGKREKIEVTWRPEKKKAVTDHAIALGYNYNFFCEKILLEHVASAAKERGWKKLDDVKEILKRLAGTQPLAGYVRGVILGYLNEHPLRSLPTPPKAENLALLKETRPDALVYAVPVNGSRIVAAPDDNGGWRGVVFDPSISGSVSVWHSNNINPPVWAKTPTVLKAIAFVASRIDMDGMCYFELPQTSIKIGAVLKKETMTFESGIVVDVKNNVRQKWTRGGYYSFMGDPKGPFNQRPNVRRALNMLCRTMAVKAGGLTANVPLH